MRIAVSVLADDAITRLGIAAQLRGQPRIQVLDDDVGGEPDVLVLAVTALDEAGRRYVRSVRHQVDRPFVLVVAQLDDHDILVAGQAGAGAVVDRRDVTSARLIHGIEVAVGPSSTAPDRSRSFRCSPEPTA